MGVVGGRARHAHIQSGEGKGSRRSCEPPVKKRSFVKTVAEAHRGKRKREGGRSADDALLKHRLRAFPLSYVKMPTALTPQRPGEEQDTHTHIHARSRAAAGAHARAKRARAP